MLTEGSAAQRLKGSRPTYPIKKNVRHNESDGVLLTSHFSDHWRGGGVDSHPFMSSLTILRGFKCVGALNLTEEEEEEEEEEEAFIISH
ncbi:hypothetical protein PBY51_015544 [Eleginops maclovinus]|uniref:Uncharacterized protein n=1 Tax=Eleginops maclovinus TaxID=56733 RepID=A0AAN7XNW2_ELEMC|nr:hypothetical protein PBY51_015544 [Eleginops maclovinus]